MIWQLSADWPFNKKKKQTAKKTAFRKKVASINITGGRGR